METTTKYIRQQLSPPYGWLDVFFHDENEKDEAIELLKVNREMMPDEIKFRLVKRTITDEIIG